MFFLPVLIYALLYIPFLGIVPFYDGGKEFRFSYNLYSGHYLSNWIPFHPPFKLLLVSLFFRLFGYDSYTFVGPLLGIAGIVALFFIAKMLFDKKVALVSALLLATSGLYLANGIFSITDFVVTVLVLVSFYYYCTSAFWLYGVVACFAVLTKETALVFPLSVLLVDMCLQKKIRISLLLPLAVFLGWLWFLHMTGHQPWNDWNFSSTAKKGSFYTVITNLLTLQIFNKYAYENWRHLFLFNFNWFFWMLAGVGVFDLITKKKMAQHTHAFLIIILYFLGYIIGALSFQTYPITRYILPVVPYMYLFAAAGFMTIKPLFFKCCIGILVAVIVLLELFTSNDPVSNMLWSKTTLFGEKVYISQLGGPDAITYNMQFLELAKKRDQLVRSGNCNKNLEYRAQMFSLLQVPLCPREGN